MIVKTHQIFSPDIFSGRKKCHAGMRRNLITQVQGISMLQPQRVDDSNGRELLLVVEPMDSPIYNFIRYT